MSEPAMNDEPREVRVSVVMPFFNAEQFLGEALESILAQTYPHWELLLIDDGSTDGSLALARSYAARHPKRVRCLQHSEGQNRGPSASRNLGIAHALGEYVALQDADDVSAPERLGKQVAFLDSHPEVALVGSWYTEIDSAGRPGHEIELPTDYIDIRWALLFYSPFLHSSVMFRRAVVRDQVGFYDETLVLSEDYDLWCRIASVLPMANLPEHLVRYRLHPASLTASSAERGVARRRRSRAAVGSLLGWDPASGHSREVELENMFALVLGWGNRYEPAALPGAVDTLLQLQEAFCRSCGFGTDVCEMHRARLCMKTSKHLTAFARQFRARHPQAARAMLKRAVELHWPALLKPRTWLTAGRVAWS
jgi:glycosyltransferase involved in cell wall biosynthesis